MQVNDCFNMIENTTNPNLLSQISPHPHQGSKCTLSALAPMTKLYYHNMPTNDLIVIYLTPTNNHIVLHHTATDARWPGQGAAQQVWESTKIYIPFSNYFSSF